MIQLIRGFRDILPGDVELWQNVETMARSILENFGFSEIRVPVMERTELFSRSIGTDTDIVEKEMYTFADRKGDNLTLRPEATASVVRSYIQHGFSGTNPVQKFYTIGPMFRRERPQKGRYRQFYQINAEMFGMASPLADVQLIYMLHLFLKRLGIADLLIHLNSLGCPECRPGFKTALADFIGNKTDMLCTDCKRRSKVNPLRVIDCKVPGCKEAIKDAPSILDHLCHKCQDHFKIVKSGLDELSVPVKIDQCLVRGLDYYTRTTFEVQTKSKGAQNAIAGGGRYDGLVKALGGKDTPAIGFAIGFDRLAELLGAGTQDFSTPPPIFIAALGPEAQKLGFGWLCEFNARGIRAEMDFSDKSLKSQMKRAGRIKAKLVIIVGDNELDDGLAMVRDMDTKEQETVEFDILVNHVSPFFQGSTSSYLNLEKDSQFSKDIEPEIKKNHVPGDIENMSNKLKNILS